MNFTVWSCAIAQISLPIGVVAASPTIVATTATAPIAGSSSVRPRLARAAMKPPISAPAASTTWPTYGPPSSSWLVTSVAVNMPPPTRK